jgi:phosphatidate cytidylyltransferase
MSNLLRRLLTAFVFGPIILSLMYIAPPVGFTVFVAIAVGIAAWELFSLSHPDSLGRAIGVLVTVGYYFVVRYTDFGRLHGSIFALATALLSPIALLLTLVRPQRIAHALVEVGTFVLSPLYVGAMMATVPLMLDIGTRTQGAGLVLLTLMIAWLSDTVAMGFGKLFQGPKLYPAVSPNKTWSGALGGLLGSMLGALIAHFGYLPSLPLGKGLAVAVIAGVVGQAGDLCESVLKRAVGVKDSGAVLPGHGGFLDRIDALTFASATVYLALRAGWLTLQ